MTNTLKCDCMFPRTPTHDSKHVYFLQLKPTYSTDQTQHNSRADTNLTLGLLSGLWWGLFWVWFFLICVHSGITLGSFGSTVPTEGKTDSYLIYLTILLPQVIPEFNKELGV